MKTALLKEEQIFQEEIKLGERSSLGKYDMRKGL